MADGEEAELQAKVNMSLLRVPVCTRFRMLSACYNSLIRLIRMMKGRNIERLSES